MAERMPLSDATALRAELDRLVEDLDLPAGPSGVLRCRGIDLPLGRRTLVMGIVNVTADSFSGDGLGDDVAAAVAQGRRMVEAGADLLDVGGESTRPGAEEVPADEELRRVLPVVERLAGEVAVPISIDTYKPAVARAALAAGARVVNDVTGLQGDPEMAAIAAEYAAPVVAMHMQGRPRTMQRNPTYHNLVSEIAAYLARSVEIAMRAGVPRSQVVIDPGIGFGKTLQHNLEILRRLGELKALGQPLLIGTSRKAFIGRILGGVGPSERVEGTAATVALAIAGGADAVRVHDVAPIVRVVRVADAIVRGYEG